MIKDRSATNTLFGFNFQVNAAIVLMLENIKDLVSLKLEGIEDIEIKLKNDKYILAQAKAVVKSNDDFNHVRANLNKALSTLSEASQKVNVQQLIFVTNSPNPFNTPDSLRIFGHSMGGIINYDSLPASCKNIIEGFSETNNFKIDTSKLLVRTIPFFSDIEEERYKHVIYKINEFINGLNINNNISRELHKIWTNDIFTNGSKSNNIKLDKQDIIWPILVIITDIGNMNNDYSDYFTDDEYEDIVNNYKEYINYSCTNYRLYTKVIYDFKEFNYKGNTKDKIHNFISEKWNDYALEIGVSETDIKEKKILIQIILYSIISKRIKINKIKRGTGL